MGGPVAGATPVVVERGEACGVVEANWGRDWGVVLAGLEQLVASGGSCRAESLSSKKYAAHFNYGVALESNGEIEPAIVQYQAAVAIDGQRPEALAALLRLGALPEPTTVPCPATVAPRPDPAPAEAPDPASFVYRRDGRLFWDGRPFQVRGVNYYPRHAPWQRFLPEADLPEMEEELALIGAAGFNTIRVFLWYDALFVCEPEAAIPVETAFAKVDGLFQLAGEHGLKVIVTLNDLPDLTFRPLYSDWPRYDAQTMYIVRRYRNEAGLLAWDLRNEGDLDYGARLGDAARFSQEEVIGWLVHAAELVRENDPDHLVTAGWWGNPAATAPYADVLSFHHWTGAGELQARVAVYRRESDKPLLLEEVGYHSWKDAPRDGRDEAAQARLLAEAIGVAEGNGLAGWLVWTAFDFAPEPGQPWGFEHFFGLWRPDLTPKAALDGWGDQRE
ncbi:MAG: cellulase family glycosylhydrolase [Chloroflexi bacterium]|nr:cellulase family glycosylhydrolase [Chloroflexota bacterium]MCI0647679.1 cellulase family glycosylhydrolase [Chloroflexota bacterium]MCI0730109.1 cellulase family glycosylhydrolase [Chloroflexota bacterium]